VESLAERGGSEVQRVKEDARKKVQQVEDLLTKRIHLLEEVSLQMPGVLPYRRSVFGRGGGGSILFSPKITFQQKCSLVNSD
jgi:hypothetical protein